MKVVYTKHAGVDKIAILASHGFKLSKRLIRKVVEKPDNIDLVTDSPNVIASKIIDNNHVLRVVYRRRGDIITVITFYPAEKGRYY